MIQHNAVTDESTANQAIDADVPLSADWQIVYRAMAVEVGYETACIDEHPWCHGPAAVDLGASTLGVCETCVTVAGDGR